MSRDTKKSDKYIRADGEILEGEKARQARVEASLHTLMREIPPPTISLTLRQPNPVSSVVQEEKTASDGTSDVQNVTDTTQEDENTTVSQGKAANNYITDLDIKRGQNITSTSQEDGNTTNTQQEKVVADSISDSDIKNGGQNFIKASQDDENTTVSVSSAELQIECEDDNNILIGLESKSQEVVDDLTTNSHNFNINNFGPSCQSDHDHPQDPPDITEDTLSGNDSNDDSESNSSSTECEHVMTINSGSLENEPVNLTNNGLGTSAHASENQQRAEENQDTYDLRENNSRVDQTVEDNQQVTNLNRQHEVSTMVGCAKLIAKASVSKLDKKVQTRSVNSKDIAVRASAQAAATGIGIKATTMDLTGAKVEATATTQVKSAGIDIKAQNMDAAAATVGANTSAKVQATVLKAKATTLEVSGIKADISTCAEANVDGLSGNLLNAEVNIAQGGLSAKASVSANAAKVKAAETNITGMETTATASSSANVRGIDIKAGRADIQGLNIGAKASATAEATGLDIKAGTAKISGAEITATASANASIGSELKVANANISGFDGFSVEASVKAKPGIRALNVDIGVTGRTGISASAEFQVGNVVLKPGLPGISLTPALNLGIGGGGASEGGG